MIPLGFLVGFVTVVSVSLGVAALVVIGPSRLRATAGDVRPRARQAAPSIVALGFVLILNGLFRDVGVTLSWLVGLNITQYIFAIEGQFVVAVQSLARPGLTLYFAAIYLYGYAVLLVFPLLAYLALPDARSLRETTVAYTINYAIGLTCYVLFIAYGPRNVIPDLVDPLLYDVWPSSEFLTTTINRNTNVFPSLHTSLSVTVALMAYRTRDIYPVWFPIAAVLAASVAVATMYLGIHWATDVVAGTLVAYLSVRFAERLVPLSQWVGENR